MAQMPEGGKPPFPGSEAPMSEPWTIAVMTRALAELRARHSVAF